MSKVRSYSNKRKIDAGSPPVLEPGAEQTASAAAGGPRFHCDLCNSCFDSETEVQVHRPIAHHTTILEGFAKHFGCCVCLKWFPLARQLRSHVRRMHLYIEEPGGTKIRRPIFICNECQCVFFNKAMLKFHNIFRHNCGRRPRRMNCPKCSKRIAVSSMHTHMDVMHSLSVETCPICLEYQSSLPALKAHMRRRHPPVYPCNFCGYISSEQRALDVHLDVAHGRTGGKGEVSTLLFARYFTQDNTVHGRLKRKPQLVSRELRLQDMLFICVLCQETVHNDTQMLKHINLVHAHGTPVPRRRFECGDCGVSCGTELLLKHHIFKQHELIKLEIQSEDTQATHPQVTVNPLPITQDEITDNTESDMCQEPTMAIVVKVRNDDKWASLEWGGMESEEVTTSDRDT